MEAAVKKALGTSLFKPTGSGGGGCISKGSSYLTDKGTVFVKANTKDGVRCENVCQQVKTPKNDPFYIRFCSVLNLNFKG